MSKLITHPMLANMTNARNRDALLDKLLKEPKFRESSPKQFAFLNSVRGHAEVWGWSDKQRVAVAKALLNYIPFIFPIEEVKSQATLEDIPNILAGSEADDSDLPF